MADERIDLVIAQPPVIELTLLRPGAPVPAAFSAFIVGPPGPQGEPGPVALRMVTTVPLPIFAGAAQLPSAPVGDVVWNMALVYLDLRPGDFDASGALRADRNYLVEEHIVRTAGSSVIFTHAPPADGCHAVVTYLFAP